MKICSGKGLLVRSIDSGADELPCGTVHDRNRWEIICGEPDPRLLVRRARDKWLHHRGEIRCRDEPERTRRTENLRRADLSDRAA